MSPRSLAIVRELWMWRRKEAERRDVPPKRILRDDLIVELAKRKSDDIEPRSDLAARLPRDVPIFLYHGRNDETVPFAHVELYALAIPRAHVRRLANRDHQLNNDLSELASDIRRLGYDSNAEPPCQR